MSYATAKVIDVSAIPVIDMAPLIDGSGDQRRRVAGSRSVTCRWRGWRRKSRRSRPLLPHHLLRLRYAHRTQVAGVAVNKVDSLDVKA